jgi:hypothetical protein
MTPCGIEKKSHVASGATMRTCNLRQAVRVADDIARLEFTPHAEPYGGTDSMEALIRAFGFSILKTNEP